MSFLDEYIASRGEDAVIRTKYGILDKVTGEQLVAVKDAAKYFDELVEIEGKPNQGSVIALSGNA